MNRSKNGPLRAKQIPNTFPAHRAAALKRLLDGNSRYAANTPEQKDFSSGRAARVSAQYPIAAILSCADSRVAPELAFDQGPGDLFVVRVAGNVVSPDLLASLEYGVQFLGAAKKIDIVAAHYDLATGKISLV